MLPKPVPLMSTITQTNPPVSLASVASQHLKQTCHQNMLLLCLWFHKKATHVLTHKAGLIPRGHGDVSHDDAAYN